MSNVRTRFPQVSTGTRDHVWRCFASNPSTRCFSTLVNGRTQLRTSFILQTSLYSSLTIATRINPRIAAQVKRSDPLTRSPCYSRHQSTTLSLLKCQVASIQITLHAPLPVSQLRGALAPPTTSRQKTPAPLWLLGSHRE